MYIDDELLPISALSHMMYCERRAALVHVEQSWEENRFTAEGHVMHERAHDGPSDTRGTVRTARGLRIRSFRLGLIGQADIVEFHKQGGGTAQPFPVEYKRGKPKSNRCDEVQLCAQAMCLEEMLAVSIPSGALFYGQPRRRTDVVFDSGLRTLTEDTAHRLHELIRLGITPMAVYEKKCDACSLYDLCKPKTTGQAGSVQQYMEKMIAK